MIYFAQKEGSDLIKIGVSKNVRSRLKTLSNNEKKSVVALRIEEGEYADEQALHSRFAHLRVSGEWFRPGDDLMEYILALPDREIPEDFYGDEKHRLTLHIPKPLHDAATKEAKARYTSLTGLILQALSKEVETK